MSKSMSPRGRLAINGMGRIGRNLFRVLLQKSAFQSLIAVNDVMSKENLIYLLQYDSIRGNLSHDISSTDRGFLVNDHEVYYSQESDIANLSWQAYSIDTVVEATGLFTHSSEASLHLSAGAKRVLLSTYSKDIPSGIWGVNQHTINRQTKIVSPGDCTINCVAPILKAVRQKWGIESAHINMIQGYTTRQELLDSPYKGFRRGRAAANSIIPFEVNIKSVLENILPALEGKIESMSTRVPVPCGALADISIVAGKSTHLNEVNNLFENSSQKELENIISITYDPIVSSDILGNPHSGVIDGTLTRVTNDRHLRLMVWFDNEWGYSNRLYDWIIFLN
jgi:glyceraldehyde 3-phosphate dehydrogenase